MKRAWRGLGLVAVLALGMAIGGGQQCSPPELVPLAWSEAGFTLDQAQGYPALEVRVCDEAFFDCMSVNPDPTSPVSVDLLGMHLGFDAVSHVEGNRFEFGIANLVFEPGAQALSQVSIDLRPQALVDVPRRVGPVTHLVFGGGEAPASQLGVAVAPFLAGDRIRRFEHVFWSVEGLSSAEPVTRCERDEQPGIVLDDCLRTRQLFLPGPAS